MKRTHCERCDEPSTELRPVVNSISQTYLCPTCYAKHEAKHGAEPSLDPFARIRANRALA